MKDGYTIIDAHAHIFPDKIAEKATAGISQFYDLPMAYQGTIAELIQNGFDAGVDGFLVCSVATTVSQVNAINLFLASCASAYPMCVPFGALHPSSPNLEDDFEQIKKLHMRGVKLHPDFQKFAIDDPTFYLMYAMIEESGLPILLHMGDARSDLSHPKRLAHLLEQFPHLNVIAAHLGGWGRWQEAQECLYPHDNVRFDTSSSLPFLSPDEAKKQVLHCGIENCFFGVDYPMWDYNEEINRLINLGFSKEDNQRIFSTNFIDWMNTMPRY